MTVQPSAQDLEPAANMPTGPADSEPVPSPLASAEPSPSLSQAPSQVPQASPQSEDTLPRNERIAALQDHAEGLPFRDGADVAPDAPGGEGVSMDGVEFSEAPSEVLEQATIVGTEAPAEPVIPNTAGQGIDLSRGAAAKRQRAAARKGPPALLHFSAATVAAAARKAPSPDLVPIGEAE